MCFCIKTEYYCKTKYIIYWTICEWLRAQVNSEEYSSKSELVNDLIRQVQNQQVQSDWIRAKLNKSEANGFTDDTSEQILKQSKSLLNGST